ncbi:RDD family protein [Pedobacter changchengzhani]|uniref:RDD family protein n=1 Tax=Pedobacter changchengzhani TaxID=2529274 RepID=A0A4R5MIQ9_9SPHI|nr:RDD family protein [Pedobacter changchengzhani]TDG35430.1 RDD family protein [Pedobacter changchengzhani]
MNYTVVVNGKSQGPYTLTELEGLNITPDTFVRKPGMDDYKEAHEIEELRELFGFTHQKTAPQYFAGFDLRLLASVIDHFIIFTTVAVITLSSFIFIDAQTQRLIVFLLPLPFIGIIKLIYGSIAESSIKQATLGKRLVGIKVSDLIGNRISFKKSLARNFTKILSFLPFCFGYFYSFLNSKKQCWHDMITNTLVIKDRLV